MRIPAASLLILLASSPAALARGKSTPVAGHAGVATPTPNPHPKAPETNEAGFAPPDLSGYKLLPYPRTGTTDATPAIPGKETLVETYQNRAGDEVMKMSLHGITFAFGVLPGGDAKKGYILLDPKCQHKLTVKIAPDAAFEAPKCAIDAPAK